MDPWGLKLKVSPVDQKPFLNDWKGCHYWAIVIWYRCMQRPLKSNRSGTHLGGILTHLESSWLGSNTESGTLLSPYPMIDTNEGSLRITKYGYFEKPPLWNISKSVLVKSTFWFSWISEKYLKLQKPCRKIDLPEGYIFVIETTIGGTSCLLPELFYSRREFVISYNQKF